MIKKANVYQFIVSYYLGDFFHTYTETAVNEYTVIEKVLKRIPPNSQYIFHGLTIKKQ